MHPIFTFLGGSTLYGLYDTFVNDRGGLVHLIERTERADLMDKVEAARDIVYNGVQHLDHAQEIADVVGFLSQSGPYFMPYLLAGLASIGAVTGVRQTQNLLRQYSSFQENRHRREHQESLPTGMPDNPRTELVNLVDHHLKSIRSWNLIEYEGTKEVTKSRYLRAIRKKDDDQALAYATLLSRKEYFITTAGRLMGEDFTAFLPRLERFDQIDPDDINIHGFDEKVDNLAYVAALAERYIAIAPEQAEQVLPIYDDALKRLYTLTRLFTTKDMGQLELQGETNNAVYRLKQPFARNLLLFKEGESLEQHRKEMDATEQIRSLLKGHTQWKVPRPIAVFEPDHRNLSKPVYVMSVAQGETLDHMMNDNPATEAINRVLPFLTYLASHLPPASNKERLEDKLYARLDNKDFIPDDQKREQLLQHAAIWSPSLLEDINQFPYIANLDAQPENWIIGDQITRIDLEPKPATSAIFDICKLFEYHHSGPFEDKLPYLRQHMHALGLELPDEDLCRGYLSATVYLAISVGSYRSSPKVKEKWPMRKILLQNALRAADALASTQAYDLLRKDLRDIYDGL
ncbi:hypothetical protein H6504_03475 [Candidatus Woesearchaeota archaeon]|nr:hypothetical protein [Candidatus Woesearchaeota archaeon]